jgi:hypothetical protein
LASYWLINFLLIVAIHNNIKFDLKNWQLQLLKLLLINVIANLKTFIFYWNNPIKASTEAASGAVS